MISPHVLEVTSESFERDVLQASLATPVIVDFWAPWCGPCRALGPLLEKLAEEYGGRFHLAKINSDENLELAQAFNVRSIPDVRAFRDGQQVSQFMGALPERQVRAFIDSVVPAPAEIQRQRAAQLRASGDSVGAIAALREALELDPTHDPARIDLAEALIEGGHHDEAEQLLAAVREEPDWNARVSALRKAIGFAQVGGSEIELAIRVASNPGDLEARLTLAGALASRKAWREAMEHLLEIVRRDKTWHDGEARKQLLAIFSLAHDQPDLISDYRRKLASTLN